MVEPVERVNIRWPELLTLAPVTLAPGDPAFPAQPVNNTKISKTDRNGPAAFRKYFI
jgi:hypothetical protein